MRKTRRVWVIRPVIILLLVVCFALCLVSLFTRQYIIFYVELSVVLLVTAYVIFSVYRNQKDIYRFLTKTASSLDLAQKDALLQFPLPTIMVGDNGEIIWYNELFRENLLRRGDVYGQEFRKLFDLDLAAVVRGKGLPLFYGEKHYMAYGVRSEMRTKSVYTLFFMENTELVKVREEYYKSRPGIMTIVIDNYDELFQNSKDSEKTRISGEIENIFEKFVNQNEGIIKRLNRDRYVAVVEDRYLEKIIQGRFTILDEVRQIVGPDHLRVTLSIGVGRGARTYPEGDQMARQALEMALGRGGDQAAVKTPNGYEFYGGVSKGIEKNTKVKTRIIASAMIEIIKNCDNCIVMGHRLADLDCFGSAVGMAAAVRRMGKQAVVAIDRRTNLVGGLMQRLEDNGYKDYFRDPAEAMEMISRKTLLIITDTHVSHLVESRDLYERCPQVIVIDHHRRMIGYIDNAVVFYHEPYASSASEMVTELLQYFDQAGRPTRLEAEALLAGIALDTKNFVLKTGVRTFEAAAYLRKNGADTVEVKKLFSSNIDAYQKRANIVSGAKLHKNCAIAATAMDGDDMRIVAPQSADELLTIDGVIASFVLYQTGNKTQISSRSFGEVNVQIIMEKLGGGGHLTMAGAAVEAPVDDAETLLIHAIDEYLSEQPQAKA